MLMPVRVSPRCGAWASRVLAAGLSLFAVLGPASAHAAPEATPEATREASSGSVEPIVSAPQASSGSVEPVAPALAAAPSPTDMGAVQATYAEGRAQFETFDYRGAIETWTRAYGQLGDTPHEREIKAVLLYNIAMAHQHAYAQDEDAAHIQQSIALLEKYLDEYKHLYEATDEHRRHVAEVEANLDELRGAPVPTSRVVVPVVVPAKVKVRALLREDPELSVRYRRGRSLVTGGAVLIAVGGSLLIATLQFVPDYGPGDIDLPIMAGLSGTALAAGAAMLGAGIPIKRRAIREAQARVAFTPQFGPAHVGMQLRF